MEPLGIISKYYPEENELRRLLILHSSLVADLSLEIANGILKKDPGKEIDLGFIREAAMLHDIGIFRCDAPSIHCTGTLPYICHGTVGREILDSEGYPRHALVCERHTGTGLSAEEIRERELPVPQRDMIPLSLEEKIICYADKFYSKSGDPRRRRTREEVRASMARHGEGPLSRLISLEKDLLID